MPKKGYQSITLKDEIVKKIDELVNKKNKKKKTRQKIISNLIDEHKEDHKWDFIIPPLKSTQ